MRIADQHALILLAAFIIAILAADLASSFAGAPLVAAVFVGLAALNFTVVRRRAWAWLWRRAGRRLARACADEDVEEALALADRYAAESSIVGGRELFVANRGIALLVGERWQSGIQVLRGIDRRLLSPLTRIMVDNGLAWGLAHGSAIDEALPLARATVDAARAEPRADARLRASCIGTLGATLVRANMPEPGLVHLREAFAIGGDPRSQAIRLLYMGDAELALGRDAEARAAWAEAARLAPASRWGRRAGERLKSASPVPYR